MMDMYVVSSFLLLQGCNELLCTCHIGQCQLLPEKWLEMQIFELHPRPIESKTLGWAQQSVF